MLIDLTPQAIRDARRRRVWARRWGRGLGVYAVAIGMAWAAVMAPTGGVSPRLEGERRRLDEAAMRAAGERVRLAAALSDVRRRLEAARAVGEHPEWATLLRAVASVRGEMAVLESVALSEERVAVTAPARGAGAGGSGAGRGGRPLERRVHVLSLEGHAAGPGKVFEFARALEGLGVFDRVVVKGTSAGSLGGVATTRMEIRAEIDGMTEAAR
jgi:hypothetical protein